MRVDTRKERHYAEMAANHIKITKLNSAGDIHLPTIKPKTPEWAAWRRYFVDHLGFLPYIMQMRENFGDGEMTVPAELPEQFDASYAAAIDLAERLRERL